MSYMRVGYPLKYFKKGITESYVFSAQANLKGDVYIEDYGDEYKDNKSFIELIGTFVRNATQNEEYAWKIVKILAKKLKVDKDLRKKPLTINQEINLFSKGLDKEYINDVMKEIKESKNGRRKSSD